MSLWYKGQTGKTGQLSQTFKELEEAVHTIVSICHPGMGAKDESVKMSLQLSKAHLKVACTNRKNCIAKRSVHIVFKRFQGGGGGQQPHVKCVWGGV